jgi:hypothetical protein
VPSRENLNQSRLIKLIIDNLVVVDDFLLLYVSMISGILAGKAWQPIIAGIGIHINIRCKINILEQSIIDRKRARH